MITEPAARRDAGSPGPLRDRRPRETEAAVTCSHLVVVVHWRQSLSVL